MLKTIVFFIVSGRHMESEEIEINSECLATFKIISVCHLPTLSDIFG